MKFLTLTLTLTLLGGLFSGVVYAEWRRVDAMSDVSAQSYIDLDNMKQTGPMSIYRQVQLLTNYTQHQSSGAGSRVQWLEYDCMQPRVRMLRGSGFSLAWAKGETVSLPAAPQALANWRDVAHQPSERAVISLICPGGSDG